MSDNRRVSILFLLNILLYMIAGEINYILGNLSIHLQGLTNQWLACSFQFHIDALLIVFFGLYLTRFSSFMYTALLGFLADAVHPAPQGTYLVGYLLLWVFFVWCQRRIRRQNPTHIRSVTVAGQSLWLLSMGLFMAEGQWNLLIYWQRILIEIIFSGALLYLIAWPWCRFQQRFLYSMGWDLEAHLSRY